MIISTIFKETPIIKLISNNNLLINNVNNKIIVMLIVITRNEKYIGHMILLIGYYAII